MLTRQWVQERAAEEVSDPEGRLHPGLLAFCPFSHGHSHDATAPIIGDGAISVHRIPLPPSFVAAHTDPCVSSLPHFDHTVLSFGLFSEYLNSVYFQVPQ